MDLAVLGAVLDRGSWSDVGLELVETESDDLRGDEQLAQA